MEKSVKCATNRSISLRKLADSSDLAPILSGGEDTNSGIAVDLRYVDIVQEARGGDENRIEWWAPHCQQSNAPFDY